MLFTRTAHIGYLQVKYCRTLLTRKRNRTYRFLLDYFHMRCSVSDFYDCICLLRAITQSFYVHPFLLRVLTSGSSACESLRRVINTHMLFHLPFGYVLLLFLIINSFISRNKRKYAILLGAFRFMKLKFSLFPHLILRLMRSKICICLYSCCLITLTLEDTQLITTF